MDDGRGWPAPPGGAGRGLVLLTAAGLAAGVLYLAAAGRSAAAPGAEAGGEDRDGVVRADADHGDPLVRAVAATLAAIDPEGPHISAVLVEHGIRAMDGEVPSAGEVKVMFNLDWRGLPGAPGEREALDRTAAQAVAAVLTGHPEISKLRVVIKTPGQGRAKGAASGIAHGHESAAKVFSFTRPAWDCARAAGAGPGEPRRLLAYGDYVVRTAEGWRRGD